MLGPGSGIEGQAAVVLGAGDNDTAAGVPRCTVELRDAISVIQLCPTRHARDSQVAADGCYVVGPEHAAVIAEKDDAISSAVVSRMRNDGMLVGMRGARIPPCADISQTIAAIGASPEVDATNDNEIGICRIARPDDIVVPALIPKIRGRVAILVQPVALDETLAAVCRSPYLSNPAGEVTLELEREVTELQRRFAEVSGEAVSFMFLPGLPVESLPIELFRHTPDILHISAHTNEDDLYLRNETGVAVRLGADALAAFLPPEQPPRLVYINACNSDAIAAELSSHVAMAIGTTATIKNRAARAGALAFYERILAGVNVHKAFAAGQKMIEVMQDKQASSNLHCRTDIDPTTEILHRIPRLIADFADGDPTPKRRREYAIRFGVTGCPASTVQIVFFSDDPDLIDDKEEDLGSDLCVVARQAPGQSHVWVDAWDVCADFRLFAAGVTADGRTFSLSSTLCNAIETGCRLGPNGGVPPRIAAAVAELRAGCGFEQLTKSAKELHRKSRKSALKG